MSSLRDRIEARKNGKPIVETVASSDPPLLKRKVFSQHGVRNTAELRRVVDLPRRRWEKGIGGRHGTPEELAVLMTEAFKREGGTQVLRPVQAACLAELHDFGGLLGAIRVGGGKTHVSFLAPKVLECKRPLLLIPAKLRDKTEREWLKLQRDWVLPRIRMEHYELLGRANHADMLTNYGPDLIIADECHRLKNPSASVSRRVERYIEEHRPKFAGMSGTITKRSLFEYWKLLKWALGEERMPLPSQWEQVMEWAGALDVTHTFQTRNHPGALVLFCDEEETKAVDYGGVVALSAVRKAYQRRLTETPGVISTVDEQVSCSLSISQAKLDLDHLAPYFAQLRSGETPDGHPWSEAVDLWRHARELVSGFFYRWDPRPPQSWLVPRSNWCKIVRKILSHSRTWDSELQVVNAVRSGGCDDHWIEDARLSIPGVITNHRFPGRLYAPEAWDEWNSVKDTFKINQVPVWIDDTVLNFSFEWLKKHNGIVWTEHRAFGDRLSEISGMPYYGQGGIDKKTKKSIEDEKGPCIASIMANGEGRNLQRYSENLVVSCPPNGGVWEQLLGRTHRDGQEADEVSFEVLLGCKESWSGFQKAFGDARYMQDTTGSSQKLLFADLDIMTMEEARKQKGPLWTGIK